ncbi:class I SAM-dependent methyltransferase [Actinoplanes flavus]|uniref:Class I SAM-dependent methyltransferase n=1 Tax=Actinoplanes flavus TaxID=2820290 RepID=A0ABS3ULW0_9ACTN|nr:class I SAM-dependent methyltransferase [Actinoplanes flavus]MBO3738647.1 class I SAM-dependent methyltransferase [Actinoplanes flavus]
MDTSRPDDSTRAFYDDLASTYDLIYADWEGSLARQAEALDGVIRQVVGAGPIRALDCACGIGTQLIGLAALGYSMSGGDLSAAAVARAAVECEARGLSADLVACDMRGLPHADAGFDAVICADNALPHLLTGEDVTRALREMRRVVRPGGVVVVTTRDYDAVLADRPVTMPVQRGGTAGLRVVTTQLWDWHAASSVYDLTHLQVSETAPGRWVAASRTTRYRAWTRAELSGLAGAAGLTGIRWAAGAETGFFQPMMIAFR